MLSLIRLNKFLSQAGVASRRGADELIASGVVQINGKTVKDLGVKVNPDKDVVRVSGRILKPEQKVYIMLNKPKSVITSVSDPQERKTVMFYLDEVKERVFPVGRLDWDSEGLLLLTNDGDFANKITHPKHAIPKTYHVKIENSVKPEAMQKLLNGVTIPGGKVKFKSMEKLRTQESKHTWYRVVITQGLNRQIRNMFSKVGHDVLKLHRVAIGMLELGNLEKGNYKFLNSMQTKKIFMDPDQKPKKERQRSLKRLPTTSANEE